MCGVAGAINVPHAAISVRLMLHALQNRGEFACGIFSIHNTKKFHQRFFGNVADNFTDEVLSGLLGNQAIGHNRYPTTALKASKSIANIQPLAFRYHGLPLAIAHNGNFTNSDELEADELREAPWKTELDTEAFLQLAIKESEGDDLLAGFEKAIKKMRGSCSAVITRPRELIAIRDPSSNRPLVWAKKDLGYVVASESCALSAIGVPPEEIHEVKRGEIISFSAQGIKRRNITGSKIPCQACIFELMYFGNPHSRLFGIRAKDFRKAIGAAAARLHSIEADIIVGVPDSALLHAQGYASETQHIPLDNDIILRRHNTGRSFTQPGQAKREKVAEEKSSYDTEEIAGKRIILVDDSLVRGTTMRKIIAALKSRGALEVHVAIASPPIIKPCHTGIDTPTEDELIAVRMTQDGIRQEIGADSLHYLSLEALRTVVESFGKSYDDFCKACFDGNYWHDKALV